MGKKTEQALATEVIRELVGRASALRWFDQGMRKNPKPGELIQSLGPAKRQILSKLKSEDIKDDRWII